MAGQAVHSTDEWAYFMNPLLDERHTINVRFGAFYLRPRRGPVGDRISLRTAPLRGGARKSTRVCKSPLLLPL